MTFSYDPNLGDDTSKIRLLIGDKVDAGHLLEDEEIGFSLVQSSGNIYNAAALCIDMMIALLRDSAIDIRVETVSENNSQSIDSLMKLRGSLKAQAIKFGKNGSKGKGIRFTGMSNADAAAVTANPDFPPARFVEEQFDNPNKKSRG